MNMFKSNFAFVVKGFTYWKVNQVEGNEKDDNQFGKLEI